ncbi:UNVERIFIED_CONTAM: hypothetical protein FKN15_071808 [Acipenser sinensis]
MEDELEAWEDFYLPERVEMRVIGAIDMFPSLAVGLQLIILAGKDGNIYAYENEVLHQVANSLQDLFQKGIEFPGTKVYNYGECFAPMTEEEYDELMQDEEVKKMKEETREFIKSNEAEFLSILARIEEKENAEKVASNEVVPSNHHRPKNVIVLLWKHSEELFIFHLSDAYYEMWCRIFQLLGLTREELKRVSKRQPASPAFWEEVTDTELIAICDVAPPSTTNARSRQEQAVLQQGVAPPSASAVDPEPQPQLRLLLQEGMTYGYQPHVFSMPPKHRGSGKAAETPWGHGADRSPGPLGHPCATSHFISFHLFSCSHACNSAVSVATSISRTDTTCERVGGDFWYRDAIPFLNGRLPTAPRMNCRNIQYGARNSCCTVLSQVEREIVD